MSSSALPGRRLRQLPHDPLPLLDVLCAAIADAAVDPSTEAACALQREQSRCMEAALLGLLHGHLLAFGLLAHAPRALAAMQAAVDPAHARWIEASVRLLEEAGRIRVDASGIRDGEGEGDGRDALRTLLQDWRLASANWSTLESHARLAQAALDALEPILRGHRAATDVLFPQGSLALVQGIYGGNPVADAFNLRVAEAVLSAARASRAVGRPLRVLEIGAGTGATSGAVFDLLHGHGESLQEYCYTDLSKAFLLHARERFGPRAPYLRTMLFDAERDAQAQGFKAGSYDMVVATNVLHATRNIRRTLRNAKTLLRHGGVLVLNEMYGSGGVFTHLTFGLTAGWWLYDDAPLRAAGGPGLWPKAWRAALLDEGFPLVAVPADGADGGGSQLIFAQSDGLVRVAAATAAAARVPAAPLTPPLPAQQAEAPADACAAAAAGVHAAVIDELRRCLMLEVALDGNESFADLGLDSIVGVTFVQRLNARLGIALEPTVTFDHANAHKLARHILAAHTLMLATARPIPSACTAAGAAVQAPLAESHRPALATVPAPVPVPLVAGPVAVAIVGMSGVFAGSPDLDALWEHLRRGTDLVVPFPPRGTRADDATPSAPILGGFLDDVDRFDALFFSISGQEATYMDPQQRLFLQECWRALEDAGHAGGDLAAQACGVYVGGANGDYPALFGQHYPPQALWGNLGSLIASRISYFLDLRGPALVVDTACSSSLVAVHLACQSLATREVDAALAGGVFLLSTAGYYSALQRAGMFSPRGRCHSFDARADGFVPAEGAGAVLLKRLDDAIAQGDHVHAVIRASGVNQDGTSNGITAPSAASQEALELAVYRSCGLNPRHVQVVEAHGTGTILGDPIEHTALARVFRRYTDEIGFCVLGSIKANLGHAQAAAGIVGLLKLVLALRAREIPPSLHFTRHNPNIDFSLSPFQVCTELRPWPENRDRDGHPLPRCAVVSSFGISGTNAHLVIEEAMPQPQPTALPGPHLLLLSARTQAELRQQAERLLHWFDSQPRPDLHAVSCSQLLGRRLFRHRLAWVAEDRAAAVRGLHCFLQEATHSDLAYSGEPPAFAPVAVAPELLRGARSEPDRARRRQRLLSLAQALADGATLDASELFAPGQVRRIPLPTYPLALDRYWVPAPARHTAADSPAATTTSAVPCTQAAPDDWLLLAAEWNGAVERTTLALPARRIVLVAGVDDGVAATLRVLFPDAVCESVATIDADGFGDACSALLRLCNAAIAERLDGDVRVQVVVAGDDGEAFASGIAGFLKAAKREYPQLRGQVLALPDSGAEALGAAVERNLRDPALQLQFTQAGERHERRLRARDLPTDGSMDRFTDVLLLITGGGGELGLCLAEAFASSVGAIVLTGRSPLNPLRQARLDALRARSVDITYRIAAADDRATMAALLDELDARGLPLGIVHAAGVLRDGFMLRKNADDLRQVLAPKVRGVELIDELTATRPLRFLLLFSSITGEFGNAGQVDYAAANAWLDGFAQTRTVRVSRGERSGVTRSIGWPVWAAGGMRADAHTEAQLHQRGLRPMPVEAGARILAAALDWPLAHVVVLHGDGAALRRMAAQADADAATHAAATAPAVPAPAPAPALLQARLERRLVDVLAGVAMLPADRIDAADPLERYGIDSLMVVELNTLLAATLGDLPKTLFFEHRSLRSLASYLARRHGVACARWCELDAPVDTESDAAIPPPALPGAPLQSVAPSVLPVSPGEPIAIIGLSGRYPGAPDLETFWRNLCDGKDAVGRVPAERWPGQGDVDADVERAITTGRAYTDCGGFLEGFADFDPLFFSIAPGDAYNLNPQERLFIESCWHTVEDAGYTRDRLARQHGSRVGVFAGITKTGYELYGPALWARGDRGYPHTSFGSVANRVSYLLNLNGPSLPIDTMCSASLTAVHLGCESLRRGECELALAGGVNLYLHPSNYVMLCAQRMLSPSGRCHSFGADGDGFIPGEGVGTALLKPLAAAQRDGDPIRAVILGSAINHGGKVNGYTVPNPEAQAALVRSALRAAGLPAQAVSCIEAHGTGTRLGDPIEIAGLQQAFAEDTDVSGFCALGSLKSNIGHLEAAAGIAGLTKIVLQMQHGELVPSLHAQTPNPNIDFARSPFRLQRERAPWTRPVSADGHTWPRVAGVSSFGAGGANAHVVLQEYLQPAPAAHVGEVCIVLSARDGARLREMVQRLLATLVTLDEAALPAVACTLQLGREALDERLALAVSSIAELRIGLQRHLDGQHVPGLHRGRVARERDALALFERDDELRAAVATWIARGKLDRLLALWVRGLAVDWVDANPSRQVRCMSLPGYPFARERYWISEQFPCAGPELRVPSVDALHPLLHRNVSTFAQQAYSSRFKGDESFFADHVIEGRRVFPGVACLEMAHAAAARSLGMEVPALALLDVVWLRPLVAEGALEVRIVLVPENDACVGFRIECGPAEAAVVHCQGRAVPRHAPPPALDLAALRARCTAAAIEPSAFYAAFAAIGMEYGASHRSVMELWRGDSNVLARIDSAGSESGQEWVLPPGLVDGAMQACAALAWDGNAVLRGAMLPFALDRLDVHAVCRGPLWAWIRPSDADADAGRVRRLDIDLCDGQGHGVATLRGLAARPLARAVDASAPVVGADGLQELCVPTWQTVDAAGSLQEAPVSHLVLVCGGSAGHVEAIAASGTHCEHLSLPDDAAAAYEAAAVRLLALLQRSLAQPGEATCVVQVVVDASAPLLEGLAGMLLSASIEQPRVRGQLLRIDESVAPGGLAILANQAARLPIGGLLRRQGPVWQQRVFAALQAPTPAARPVWKESGHYWITGGAGKLGLLLAEYILRQAAHARVTLSGRRALDADTAARLAALKSRGNVAYHAVDLCDEAALESWLSEVTRDAPLHGIVHAAGVLRDGYLVDKGVAALREVLAPKVRGLVALDRLTRTQPLDFLALFGSLAGAYGNAGQADYAAANGFLDAFAVQRRDAMEDGRRHGRTVAIDWPLWRDGGMRVDASVERMMRDRHGLAPLATEDGLRAFECALAADAPQVVVLQRAGSAREGVVAPVVALAHASSPASGVSEWLVQVLAQALKLPPERLDPEAPLEHYGIDSIKVMDLTFALEKHLGPLSRTLFFEYQTAAELAEYLQRRHADALAPLLGRAPATPDRAPAEVVEVGAKAAWSAAWQTARGAPVAKAPGEGHCDVAIIGLSGRYPMADDLDQFWRNLRDARDCISEVPAERWSHSELFDDAQHPFGKSYCRWGGFLDGVAEFDPLFFRITPIEATVLDPQERLFLQCAFATLEDAGYTRDALRRQSDGRVGVYVGVMYEEYPLYGLAAQQQGQAVALTGSPSSIANRVSYVCNFSGPSMAVDSMCSSSLTTLHLACQSLRLGECAAAIAGGVNVSIHPNKYFLLEQGHFASSKGRCESFGRGGDGYVPGEGVGAVLLKPLSRALADGDHVHGVIKATAVNHGGKTNGYTVPNPRAQGAVIAEALRHAGIAPDQISYVEAHGTGTSLGDPIEIAGLLQAYGGERLAPASIALGSVKSNIGHCESAAGVAGLTKVLLQMRHGRIVASLHSDVLNPNIDFARSPFSVPQADMDWVRPRREIAGTWRELPRVAGISSFGAGGANAHVIVQEAPGSAPVVHMAGPQWVILSARTQARCRERAAQLLRHLQQSPGQAFMDVAWTLQVGREAMAARLGFVADDVHHACALLQAVLDARDGAVGSVFVGEVRSPAPPAVSEDDLVAAHSEEQRSAILQSWVAGADVPWTCLHANRTPRRVGLPTYPFERTRYWPEFARVAPVETTPAAASAAVARVLLRDWDAAPLPQAAIEPAGAVLLLVTPTLSALATALVDALPDTSVRLLSHDPAAGCDFLAGEGCDAASIDAATLVDLTAFDAGYETATALELGKLALLQRWLVAHHRDGGVLLQFTSGLEPDDRAEVPTLHGARSAGLYRVLSAEYPRIRARSIDLEADLAVPQRLAAILDELRRGGSDTAVHVRRNAGLRQAARLRSAPMPALQPEPVPQDEVVLITGGAGGIGAAVAEDLVRRTRPRALIVLGRDRLPPQSEWTQVLAGLGQGGADGARRERLLRLQRLVASGVPVRYVSVAINDAIALEATLSPLQLEFGPITALYHCAGGISEDPAFIRKPLAAIASVAAPKIAGLAALDGVLEKSLRRVVLFSSVATEYPALAVGQADYALANAYLDQFARVQRARGRRGVQSLQWPLWRSVGMGAGMVPSAAYVRAGLPLVDTDAGLDLLARAGGVDAAVLLPLPPMPATFPAVAAAQAPTASSLPLQPASQEPAAAAMAEVSAWLRALFVQEFGLPQEELDDARAFTDYGVDSILLTQVTLRMRERLGHDVDPSLMFEHDTLGKLAAVLARDPAFAAPVEAGHEVTTTPSPPVQTLTPEPSQPAAAATGGDDIVVIGLSCRLPGARDAAGFWRLLECGESAIQPVPPQRWSVSQPERYYGGWVDDVQWFDPAFFQLHELDARAMDPQARLVLEESLAALCDAGYRRDELVGARVGVYVGGRSQARAEALAAVFAAPNPILGLGQNYLATNISRCFDFTGPSMVVDTACSSGVAGLALAADALRDGRIDMALVGAVSLLQDPLAHDLFAARNILSPDSRFRLFDRQAAGDVLGEGVGMVVLKRREDALRDGDRILAQIKSIAVNNDGRTLGPGSPNMRSQRNVLREALAQAGCTPADVGYIEVNGGGSPLLDSIEIKVLSEVYRLQDRSLPPCHLGSIKPNVGHLLLGSGIAAFIRCVLSVASGRVPPFLSALDPFEFYDFGASRIVFNRETVSWPQHDGPRVAAMSSFADGGTNCHVLLQSFDATEPPSRRPLPLPPMQRRDLSPAPSRAVESDAAAAGVPVQTFWGTYVDSVA